MPSPIDPPALTDLMSSDSPHAVLDIRSREDYVAAQIFGSTTVPFDKIVLSYFRKRGLVR